MCVVNAAVGFLTTCLHLTPVVQQVSISYEFIRGLWGRSPVEYRGRASNQGAVAPLKLKSLWQLDARMRRF